MPDVDPAQVVPQPFNLMNFRSGCMLPMTLKTSGAEVKRSQKRQIAAVYKSRSSSEVEVFIIVLSMDRFKDQFYQINVCQYQPQSFRIHYQGEPYSFSQLEFPSYQGSRKEQDINLNPDAFKSSIRASPNQQQCRRYLTHHTLRRRTVASVFVGGSYAHVQTATEA